MPLARFLPYDVLGAGLWAATFSVLGYVFWRSFDQLTQWVSRGVAGLGVLDRRSPSPSGSRSA